MLSLGCLPYLASISASSLDGDHGGGPPRRLRQLANEADAHRRCRGPTPAPLRPAGSGAPNPTVLGWQRHDGNRGAGLTHYTDPQPGQRWRGRGVDRITQGDHPQDDPRRLAGEVNELVDALVAEIEWLRNELEYARLVSELPATGQPGPATGVVDAVKADPNLRPDDRDRLIAMYRDLVRQRAMEDKKPDGRA